MGSPYQLLDQYRGQKNIVQNVAAKLGETGWVLDRTKTGNNEYLNSSLLIEVQIVKSDAILTAPAGKQLSYTVASQGTIVHAITGSAEIGDGICDPDLVGDIAVGDTFLLFRAGPMNVTLGASASAGDRLKSAAAGKFGTATEMSPTSRGRLMVAASNDGDVRRAMMDFRLP